jgi:hypothetical protein
MLSFQSPQKFPQNPAFHVLSAFPVIASFFDSFSILSHVVMKLTFAHKDFAQSFITFDT